MMRDNEKVMCDLFIDSLNDIGKRFKDLSALYERERNKLNPDKERDLLNTYALKLSLAIKKQEYKSNQTSPYSNTILDIRNIVYVLGHAVYQTNDGNVYINTLYNSNINDFDHILMAGMKNQIDHYDSIASDNQLTKCGYDFIRDPKWNDGRVTCSIVYRQYHIIQYDDNRVKLITLNQPFLKCDFIVFYFSHQLDHYELMDIVKLIDSANFYREKI